MKRLRCNNMRKIIGRVLAAQCTGLALLLSTGPAAAQGVPDSLGGIVGQLARYEQRGPHEKLFLHLDRPLYLSGETMWFKVYAVDGTQSKPLALSSVAYVEVLNAEHHPVLQGKVGLKNATGQGSFLLPASLPAGSYTVRAYTSWMKNFGPDAYFSRSITVVNTRQASGAGAKDSAAFDAQFFPEGGQLVQGLPSRVAFLVTDKAGKGAAAQGQLLNGAGAVVATFRTERLGMGTFSFTPLAGQGPYVAVLTPGRQPRITHQLPPAHEQGYVLALADTGPDELTLTVRATSAQPETVFLLGHSRQQPAVALKAALVNGQATFVVRKSQLLEGVSHFTLFDAARRPVCERLYFRRPAHALAITARADKSQYTTRDQVRVEVATPGLPAPLAASLSMAVYRLDSLSAASVPGIDRYLWLTSELRGAVENPDYYFTAPGPEAAAAADNLMLTQGWSRWRWADVLAPGPPRPLAYVAEPNGPVIRGRLTQPGTGAPRPGVLAYLATPSRITRLTNAQSNANGEFQFEAGNRPGAQEIIIQTDPQQDSTCQITVLDPFSSEYARQPLPPFGLTARFRSDYATRHLNRQVQSAFAGRYRNRFVTPAVDSAAFYGKPTEQYYLDKFTRFKVLEEVLREYVPGVIVHVRKDGFHLLVTDRLNKVVLEDNPMVLLDGVPVFNMNKIMAMNPLKIRKLEVIDGRYFHGLAVYQGIVSFTTYKGDLEGFPLDAHALVQQYEGVQQQREFYSPRYETPQEKQSRLPDLRNLLYWNADLATIGAAPRTVDFFTGDQPGRYLVVVQGLAANGLAGSTSVVLEVRPAL